MSGPNDIPAGEPAAGTAQPTDLVGRKIDRLLDGILHREGQTQALLDELRKFPAAAENLVDSVQIQVDLANSLDELLAGLADRNDELARMIRSVTETAAEQSEILHKVHDALTGHDRTQEQIALALQRLTAALEHAPGDAANQLAMMEQIRQNLGKTGLAIEKASNDLVALASQGREQSNGSLDRLTRALEAMPDTAAELARGRALMAEGLQQAQAHAAGSADALLAVVQDGARRADNVTEILHPITVFSESSTRLLQRQNRLLGWLLGGILAALIALICFAIWRPPRGAAPSGPGPAAQTQPAARQPR